MINENCAKLYCSEDISLIENYDLATTDTSQVWECHHRLEIQGQFRNSVKLLKKCGMYYNVPAWQLIFLTRAEHNTLHKKGRKLSNEHKIKISEANTGKNNGMFGKHHTEEAIEKNRQKHLGKTPWNKGKLRSSEEKTKISKATSNAMKGRYWWTNGFICKFCKERPGPEWQPGRLKRS